jgi:tetratricopeptide (TPR) repeat protein
MRHGSRLRPRSALAPFALAGPALAPSVLGLALALGLPGALGANQGDPRLPQLFDQLAHADSERGAREVETQIWELWSDSGSFEVNRLLERGTRAMNAGSLDEAIALFGQAIELAPDFSEGWNKRATAYYQQGKYEASIRDVEATLALEPRHFAALSGMGLIYTELSADAPALHWFERALQVHPYMRGLRQRVSELHRKLERDRT